MLFLNRYTPRIYYANGKVASVHYLHGVLDIQHTEYYIKRNDSFNKIWFHKKYHNISLYGQVTHGKYVLDKSLCPLFWNLLFLMMLSRMFVSIQNQGSYYVTILHLVFKMSTIPGMVGGTCLLLLLLSPSSSSHFIPMWLRYLCKKLYSYLKYFSRNKTSLNTARCHVTAILFTFAS